MLLKLIPCKLRAVADGWQCSSGVWQSTGLCPRPLSSCTLGSHLAGLFPQRHFSNSGGVFFPQALIPSAHFHPPALCTPHSLPQHPSLLSAPFLPPRPFLRLPRNCGAPGWPAQLRPPPLSALGCSAHTSGISKAPVFFPPSLFLQRILFLPREEYEMAVPASLRASPQHSAPFPAAGTAPLRTSAPFLSPLSSASESLPCAVNCVVSCLKQSHLCSSSPPMTDFFPPSLHPPPCTASSGWHPAPLRPILPPAPELLMQKP